MTEEKEYVSMLDGAEDDAPIIIIPEDDDERDYTNCSSRISTAFEVSDPEGCQGTEKESRSVWGRIRDFWYYHKITVIVVLFVAAAFTALFTSFCSKSSNDITVAVCTDKKYSSNEQVALKLVLSDYIEDFNNDGMHSTEADFLLTSDESYTASQLEADYKSRVRCLYITTEDAYEYITELYPDMFESYSGCKNWIPLSGTDLCDEFRVQGIDCSDLGISLLAKPDENTEDHERAVKLLDALREKYPEMFS